MCSVFLQMLIAMRSRAMRVHSSLTHTITTLADSTTCVRECYQNSFRAITSASTPTPTPSPDLRICPSRPHDGFVSPLRRSLIAFRRALLSLLVFPPPPSTPSDAILFPSAIILSSLPRLVFPPSLCLLYACPSFLYRCYILNMVTFYGPLLRRL